MRGRCIDQDTACLHCLIVFPDLLRLRRIHIKGRCVSVPAVRHKLFRFLKSLVERLRPIHGQYWRQFLMSKFF